MKIDYYGTRANGTRLASIRWPNGAEVHIDDRDQAHIDHAAREIVGDHEARDRLTAALAAEREACAALCERMAHDLETVPMGLIRDAVARRDLAVSELRRAAKRILAGERDG